MGIVAARIRSMGLASWYSIEDSISGNYLAITNRESAIGNRESAIGNRESEGSNRRSATASRKTEKVRQTL